RASPAESAGSGFPRGCRRTVPSGQLRPPGSCARPAVRRLSQFRHYGKLRNRYVVRRNAHTMNNPFVYGEVVPLTAFVDRETELDRLTGDLLAGQKVFLISPRRYGKSSLVRQALRSAARGRALPINVTVSSYSSYPAFLEGYARALLTADAQ